MPVTLAHTAEQYRRELCENILPWWMRHAIDHEAGGICSCIRDDGTIVSYDKYVWSQVRAVWTFAAAYNRVDKNPAYLDVAKNLFEFSLDHGRNAEGDWCFLLDRHGAMKEGPASIQTDAFAICALAEYARATGSRQAIDAAVQTFERSLAKLKVPGSYGTAPYPIPPGTKAQRVSMQFSLAYFELGKLLGDDRILKEGLRLCDDVLDNFRRPEMRATVEYLSLDNALLDPPIGTYTSAGHGIETAWFQIENIRDTGDRARLAKALDIMRWSFEIGWDKEYGGLTLGSDIRGGEPYLPNADTKIWWPHCEALCGALMAYEVSGEPWCLAWYDKTYEWSYAHYPDREHGEWTQRLDRAGNRIDKLIALPVKDPFHLPRALIYAHESLRRMESRH